MSLPASMHFAPLPPGCAAQNPRNNWGTPAELGFWRHPGFLGDEEKLPWPSPVVAVASSRWMTFFDISIGQNSCSLFSKADFSSRASKRTTETCPKWIEHDWNLCCDFAIFHPLMQPLSDNVKLPACPFCTGFGKWVVPAAILPEVSNSELQPVAWYLPLWRSLHWGNWRFVPLLCWTNPVASFSNLSHHGIGRNRGICAEHGICAFWHKKNVTHHAIISLQLCINCEPGRLFLPSASLMACGKHSVTLGPKILEQPILHVKLDPIWTCLLVHYDHYDQGINMYQPKITSKVSTDYQLVPEFHQQLSKKYLQHVRRMNCPLFSASTLSSDG